MKSGAAIGASTGLEFDRPQETNALASIPLSKPIVSAPPEPEPQAEPNPGQLEPCLATMPAASQGGAADDLPGRVLL